MHDIVSYIQHHAIISLNSQCCTWNWQNWVLVHMNLPNSTNSMYGVVKWYFVHFTPPQVHNTRHSNNGATLRIKGLTRNKIR
jgi:hypothetical protein